jgi:hypothetical protein
MNSVSPVGGFVIINKQTAANRSMKVNRWLVVAGLAAGLCLSLNSAMAQDQGGQGGQGGGRQGRGQGGRGGGNFDPAQFQERMLERYKETLEVTDDAEWNVIKPLVQKVSEARMAAFSGMGRGMFGGRGRGGPGGPGGPGGDNNNQDQGGNQNQGRRGMFGQSMPEADALQKAIEAKAPKAEVKAALEKYQAARKAKQAELEQAQANLRKVLTARQEAIATLNGLL